MSIIDTYRLSVHGSWAYGWETTIHVSAQRVYIGLPWMFIVWRRA